MRRALIALLVLLVAVPAFGRDDHIRPYSEGMTAVENGDWATVEAKMREALSFQTQEEKSIRTRSGLVPYVPYFWLGIALTNQQRLDEALSALRTSERQGVIQETTHFSRLRTTKSRIESQEAASRSNAGLDEARELADKSLEEAYKAQGQATAAGASRLNEFRQGTQKLKEALAARGEGTTEGFRKSAGASTQAIQLFNSAAVKASAQPSGVKVQRRPATQPEPAPVPRRSEPVPDPASPVESRTTGPTADAVETVKPPAPTAEPPQQTRTIDVEEDLPPIPQATTRAPEPAGARRDREADLEAAYRLMAAGELERSSAMLSSLIIANPEWIDPLVLRGYSRFLDGVLSRDDRLLRGARDDFRAALALNPAIVLDERSFSPKAIEFFDALRSE